MGLLISCATDQPSTTATDNETTTSSSHIAISVQEQNALAMRESIFNDHFELAEKAAVLSLKNIFDQGLQQGLENQPLTYAYEQHALRMKLDYFNNETFEQFYPYNGAFTLAKHATLCRSIPFLTNQCGFQKEDTKEIINFFCLNLNENFFAYLAELGKTSSLIQDFQDSYQQNKAIVPQDRQNMLINSSEALELTSFDHQLFYFLFHACVNAEHQAVLQLRSE